jgi:hypothetical protein
MNIQIHPESVNVWLSPADTRRWATCPGNHWPCSFLAGKRLFAQLDAHGLVDFTVDNGRGDQDCPSAEFNAIVADALRSKLPSTHAVWFVAVGQFL